jgi:hypothetical protein
MVLSINLDLLNTGQRFAGSLLENAFKEISQATEALYVQSHLGVFSV